MTLPEQTYSIDQVREDPASAPLATLDIANPFLFEADAQGAWFKRLRDEAPVHYCPESVYGPY